MLKFSKILQFLLLLLVAAPVVQAQDEQPLRPEDAYRYVVSDTGDALEVDWAIEDEYYLYRKELSFETTSKDVTLSAARLPAGEPHEDEYFGKQQVFRENFYVSIPYRVDGDRPETIELVIKSRGCWDGGLCYPPQTWTETVTLKQPKADLATLGGANGAGAVGDLVMGDFPPPEEVFFPDLFVVDGNTIEVGVRIEPGYYVYRDKTKITSLSENARVGKVDMPNGVLHNDEFFGEQVVYYNDMVARATIQRATPEAMNLEVEFEYQGCADEGLCYMPQTVVLNAELPAAETISDLSNIRPPEGEMVSEQNRLAQLIIDGNLWQVIATFFGLGLLLAFTPCVLPMIPILTSIIAGEGEETSPARGFGLALSYVMGMALVYTAAGMAAAAAGAQLQAMFNQPWVLMIFATFFVLLAAAMFGGYDLQMPSGIQSRLAGISGNQKGGTTVGAFIMGALSALIVTACVAPALIATLIVMAQTGDMVRGGAALFAMSLGMGAPLLAVGAAQGHLLPKAGNWMIAVKSAFGFMLLGLAIWMLRTVLSGGVSMMLWAVLVFMSGVFMGGLTTITSESSAAQKLGKGFGFLAIVYGLILLLGAVAGGTNPLKPLASVNLGPGSSMMVAENNHVEFQRIKTVADLDRELEAASSAGKTAILDFYADWCVSCIEMEEYTFTDADVQAALANTVLLQADVTRNDDEDKELLQRFGVFGPPTIIFFGKDGQQRHGYEVVGYMKAKAFTDHVNKAFTEVI
jgi:thiol:disulfide interchange protein DsbD